MGQLSTSICRVHKPVNGRAFAITTLLNKWKTQFMRISFVTQAIACVCFLFFQISGLAKTAAPAQRLTNTNISNYIEVFEVFVNFVSRFAQLKAGVPQALLGFIPHSLSLLRS